MSRWPKLEKARNEESCPKCNRLRGLGPEAITPGRRATGRKNELCECYHRLQDRLKTLSLVLSSSGSLLTPSRRRSILNRQGSRCSVMRKARAVGTPATPHLMLQCLPSVRV